MPFCACEDSKIRTLNFRRLVIGFQDISQCHGRVGTEFVQASFYWLKVILDMFNERLFCVFKQLNIQDIWDIEDIWGTLLSSRTSFHIHLYPIRQRATFFRIAWFVFYEFRRRTWSMNAF